MNTREQLIKHLTEDTQVLQTPRLKKAFEAIDRKRFVPKDYEDEAYEDYPLPIGFGQTISQPTTVAFMMELLDVQPENKVLDIGSGSGYTTALLANLAGRGHVLGIEMVTELAEMGKTNLKKYDFENAKIEKRDSKSVEKAGGQTYDRILVNAAADEIPKNLFNILKTDGIMVVPIGGSIWKITKKETGNPEFHEYPGFAFVPLK